MERYDPEITPDANEWLATDEGERILLSEQYHRDARIRMPQRARRLHACLHAAVENQLAAKDDPVICAMERLLKDGLSRHDAVHAIGSCLTGLIYNIAKSEGTPETNREQYHAAIERLTAKSWRESFGD